MNCPNCKHELFPARTREDRPAIDGLKCAHCDKMFVIRAVEVAGNPTDATCVKTQTELKVASPAAPPVQRAAQASSRTQGQHLAATERAELVRRLQAGDAMKDIARDMNLTSSTISRHRRRLGMKPPYKNKAQKMHNVASNLKKAAASAPATEAASDPIKHRPTWQMLNIEQVENGFLVQMAAGRYVFTDFKTMVDWMRS